MKLTAAILAPLFLGLVAGSVLLDAGLSKPLAVPARALAPDPPTKDEQEIIDFVLNSFVELLAGHGSAKGADLFAKDGKVDEFGAAPPSSIDPENSLGSFALILKENTGTDVTRQIKGDFILLWVHVGRIGKPKATGQTDTPAKDGQAKSANKKKTSKDLAFQFTNGIVSSKIKVSYGFGGLDLLKPFIVRSCFSFMLKVEQSVPTLVVVKPLLDAALLPETLEQLFGTKNSAQTQDPAVDAGQGAFSMAYELQTEKVSHDLIFSFEGSPTKNREAIEKIPLISKLLESTEAALSKAELKWGPKTPEHLVYKITPKFEFENDPAKSEQANTPDYITYIDTFYVILVKVGSRITVMVHSRHFSDSVEISVNSKTTVIETVYNLLRKIVKETYQSFLDLDPNNKDCANPVAYTTKKLGLLAFTGEATTGTEGDSAQNTGAVLTLAMDSEFSIAATLTTEPSSDIKVVVTLSKGGANRATQQSFFPSVSQYCSGVFVTAYIKKVTDDFASIAYSEIIRTPVPEETNNPRETFKKFLGARYSSPFVKEEESYTKDSTYLSYLYAAPQDKVTECEKIVKAGSKWSSKLCTYQADLAGTNKEFRLKIVLAAQ